MSFSPDHRITKPAQRTPTCDVCKSRHQKCSGDQPQCSNCKLRSINCFYSGPRTRAPETKKLPDSTSSTSFINRPAISDADYDTLYSEIFGDIVRRLKLGKAGSPISGTQEDALLEARPGNASLPNLNREVFSIVRELVSHNSCSSSQSDANRIREAAFERGPDHIRKILRDNLPPEDVAQHLLELFLDYQNSVFYVCNREEARSQLSLMYDDPAQVSISWFCQMFLIFAVGVQFDDIYDTDGATYHEIGQKYFDDAIDESPQSTIWIIRAMLLLCFFQSPTKWNSVWMYLDAAIRGAHRFQLDLGQNLMAEISDKEYQEWRRLWLTVISFDRWVAIFLGRLPRIKESISRDPIFKDALSKVDSDDIPQNNVTRLAIISGNILRDMYFREQPNLNTCRHWKGELERWMSNLSKPYRQQIESGIFPESPKDQAEVIFNLHFMYLGACTLVKRPYLFKVLNMKSSSTFGGPIASAISSEASLCIDFASRLIKSANSMLRSPALVPKRSFMPVFFLINAAHILILAIVWKMKPSDNNYRLPTPPNQFRELTIVDSAIQTLEFCGHRNPFARRYLLLIKDLRRQLTLAQANVESPSSRPTMLSAVPSVDPVALPDSVAEGLSLQDMMPSIEQGQMLGMPRPSFAGRGNYGSATTASPLDVNVNQEMWPPGQFSGMYQDDGEGTYDVMSSMLMNPDGPNFWNGMRE